MNKLLFIPLLLFFSSGCSILNPIIQADCLVRKVVDYDKEDFFTPSRNPKTSLTFNSSNGEVYEYDEEFHRKLIRINGTTEKNNFILDTTSYIKNDTLYVKYISHILTDKSIKRKNIMVLDLSKKTYYWTSHLYEGFSWRKLFREEGICKLVKPKITEILK
jgi:hypothetical protein